MARVTKAVFLALILAVLQGTIGSETEVAVRNSGKPVVTVDTYIPPTDDMAEKDVHLKCSVPSGYVISTCIFRNPRGQEIRGSVDTTSRNECRYEIINVQIPDMGIWRCDLETSPGLISYGFVPALCPHAMSVPGIAAQVVAEPTLTVHEPSGVLLEGDSTTLSCSIQSAIRYCYFRARNGTVFNVWPGKSLQNMEYVGAGLDAGECGIRISTLSASDSGQWSCHVGIPDLTEPEQRVNFQLTVLPPLEVEQTTNHGNTLVIRGQAFSHSPLEYCRYVRMDGQGISSAHLPERYTTQEGLSSGLCMLTISNPTILEHHPWHVAAKVVGREGEIYGDTTHTITMPSPETTAAPELVPTVAPPAPVANGSNNNAALWVLGTISFLLIVLVGVLLIPKRNRTNTLSSFGSFRSTNKHAPSANPQANV